MRPLFAVIPVKNQLHYTKGLIDQLLGQAEGQILVIDNGSTDGTVEWVAARMMKAGRLAMHIAPGVFLHQMWNFGLDWAKSESPTPEHSVALLNNDLRIGDHFLSQLDEALHLHEKVAVAGARYDNRKWPSGARAITTEDICANRYDGTGGLPGFAFMLRGEDGYRFPEALHWWYGDNDMVKTFVQAGRLCVIARDAVCEHLDGGGRTGDWQDKEMKRLTDLDAAWFARKWRKSA